MGRDITWVGLSLCGAVSIHAPRVGRDGHSVIVSPPSVKFQFTRPAWGAYSWYVEERKRRVSIHAPRVGRDGYCNTFPCNKEGE